MDDIVIKRGKTFQRLIRWETAPIVRKPITAVSLVTGAPRLTVAGHGLPNGWRAYCYGIKGTVELNAADPERIRSSDYYEVTVIDADTVEFNGVNAADFKPYVSGGFLAWNTPHDLAGYICRAKVKTKIGGALLLSTEAGDTPLNLMVATVDDTAKSVSIAIPATATQGLLWKAGVIEVEIESPGGIVEQLVEPTPLTVEGEVVTP